MNKSNDENSKKLKSYKTDDFKKQKENDTKKNFILEERQRMRKDAIKANLVFLYFIFFYSINNNLSESKNKGKGK